MDVRVKTVKEAAEMLGVTAPTIYKRLRTGELIRVKNSTAPTLAGGRPVTLIAVSSIVNYIKTH